MKIEPTSEVVRYCSFCGKSHHETEVMLAAPGEVNICVDCVLECMGIITTEQPNLVRIDIRSIEYGFVKNTIKDPG